MVSQSGTTPLSRLRCFQIGQVWKFESGQLTRHKTELNCQVQEGLDLLKSSSQWHWLVILEKSSTRKGWWLQGHLHHWTPVDYTTASQHENRSLWIGSLQMFQQWHFDQFEKVHLDPERRVPSRRRLLRIGFWREILLGPGFRESITQLWFQ